MRTPGATIDSLRALLERGGLSFRARQTFARELAERESEVEDARRREAWYAQLDLHPDLACVECTRLPGESHAQDCLGVEVHDDNYRAWVAAKRLMGGS